MPSARNGFCLLRALGDRLPSVSPGDDVPELIPGNSYLSLTCVRNLIGQRYWFSAFVRLRNRQASQSNTLLGQIQNVIRGNIRLNLARRGRIRKRRRRALEPDVDDSAGHE